MSSLPTLSDITSGLHWWLLHRLWGVALDGDRWSNPKLGPWNSDLRLRRPFPSQPAAHLAHWGVALHRQHGCHARGDKILVDDHLLDTMRSQLVFCSASSTVLS